MTEENSQQQFADTPSRLATRMADLFLNSIDLIEQKVAEGDTQIALGYLEAFHLYHIFDRETNEKSALEERINEILMPQTEVDQFLQKFNALSNKPEVQYDE